jgi:hypothetical protein
MGKGSAVIMGLAGNPRRQTHDRQRAQDQRRGPLAQRGAQPDDEPCPRVRLSPAPAQSGRDRPVWQLHGTGRLPRRGARHVCQAPRAGTDVARRKVVSKASTLRWRLPPPGKLPTSGAATRVWSQRIRPASMSRYSL